MSLSIENLLEIIIVTYNSGHVLGNCLSSLPDNANITIVDNNSKDSTVQVISNATNKKIKLIQLNNNVGFGAAVNRALAECLYPYALVLNPDSIMSIRSIKELLNSAINHKDAAIIAPLQFAFDNKVKTNSCLNDPRKKVKGNFIEPEGEVCVDVVPATAILLVMDKFLSHIGFFDECFFLYYEDTDLCLRVRRAGYSCIINPRAKLFHDPGNSCNLPNKTFQYIEYRTSHYLFKKKYNVQKFVVLRSILKTGYCIIRIMLNLDKHLYRNELSSILKFWARLIVYSAPTHMPYLK